MTVLTTESVMDELRAMGTEKARVTYARHGMPMEHTLGVSVADLKTVAKKIKGRQDLAGELYETGFMEAMYLAGMVADGAKMSRSQLQSWAEGSLNMTMISEYTVPWVTVENPEGCQLAKEWIRSDSEGVASSGWCTYSGLVGTRADSDLDLGEIEELLGTVVKDIGGAKNRVRYTMNGFVISVGIYVKPLLEQAKATAEQIGFISVNMGDTACKMPVATEYIAKIEAAGKVGLKRKTIRC